MTINVLAIALTFDWEAIRWIYDAVRGESLRERGGLLTGEASGLCSAVPAHNQAADPRSEFTIDAEQLAKLSDWIAASELELIGSWHSHPNGNAQMSSADAAMARATGMLLIVAPASPWQWRLWDPVAGGEVGFAIAPPRR